jgi:putative hemolysin
VVVVITYPSHIFGEFVPKRIALNDYEQVAIRISRPMPTLSVIASLSVRLLSISTDTMLRLLWKNNIPQPLVTEEEVRLLLEQGRDRGDRGEEKAMIKR